MPTFEKANISLYYEHYEANISDAPWVVFLNGMTQTTLNWKSLCRALAPQVNVLTYDARGQGKSDIGDEDLTLSLHAEDLHDLLTHLGIEHANMAGFSHGARIALAFANAYPEQLDRLIICSATAMPTAMARTIIRGWRVVLEKGGLEAMSWMSLSAILGADFLEDNESLIEGIIKASVRRNSQEGVSRLLQGMLDYPDLADLATGVECPTLVLSADEDMLVDRQGAQKLAQLCGGEHIEVQGVGHTIPIEAPDVFLQHVQHFFLGAS